MKNYAATLQKFELFKGTTPIFLISLKKKWKNDTLVAATGDDRTNIVAAMMRKIRVKELSLRLILWIIIRFTLPLVLKP